jgi:cytochrome b subunit of formate dehydrogenase
VNPVLFASAFMQAVSGLALALNGPEFLRTLHIYNAFLLSFMIAVHLALNWGWVRSYLKSGER